SKAPSDRELLEFLEDRGAALRQFAQRLLPPPGILFTLKGMRDLALGSLKKRFHLAGKGGTASGRQGDRVGSIGFIKVMNVDQIGWRWPARGIAKEIVADRRLPARAGHPGDVEVIAVVVHVEAELDRVQRPW